MQVAVKVANASGLSSGYRVVGNCGPRRGAERVPRSFPRVGRPCDELALPASAAPGPMIRRAAGLPPPSHVAARTPRRARRGGAGAFSRGPSRPASPYGKSFRSALRAHGQSPYAAPSAFAGNPSWFDTRVDQEPPRSRHSPKSTPVGLDDWSLFAALEGCADGECPWLTWDERLRRRESCGARRGKEDASPTRSRAMSAGQYAFREGLELRARARARSRGQDSRRRADLPRARFRRCRGPIRTCSTSTRKALRDDGCRGSSGLLQRDRSAVGESGLSLGTVCAKPASRGGVDSSV
jgi:hypothetical protein